MESLGQAIATGIALLAAFSAAVWAASFVWAYQDIRRRTAAIYVQLFASLLVLLLGPFGAILYLIMRPAETLDEIHFRKIHAEALLQDNIPAPNGPTLYGINGSYPSVGNNVFLAPGVQLIGDVRVEDDASIWYNTVIRADLAPVTIGRGINIQDGCVVHVDPDRPVSIGADVTIGHMAMIHGCTIEDECLIGIQSTVLSGAVIRRHSIVGAAALIGEEKTFEEGSVLLGVPAQATRDTTEAEVEHLIRTRAQEYRSAAASAQDALSRH